MNSERSIPLLKYLKVYKLTMYVKHLYSNETHGPSLEITQNNEMPPYPVDLLMSMYLIGFFWIKLSQALIYISNWLLAEICPIKSFCYCRVPTLSFHVTTELFNQLHYCARIGHVFCLWNKNDKCFEVNENYRIFF